MKPILSRLSEIAARHFVNGRQEQIAELLAHITDPAYSDDDKAEFGRRIKSFQRQIAKVLADHPDLR